MFCYIFQTYSLLVLPLIEIAKVESETVFVNALIFPQSMSPKRSPTEKFLKCSITNQC